VAKRDIEERIGWLAADLERVKATTTGTSDRRLALVHLRNDATDAIEAEYINLGHDEANAEAKSKKSKRAKGTR
jgi:hypothetical protein